jgi:succinate-acetate transporter protein
MNVITNGLTNEKKKKNKTKNDHVYTLALEGKYLVMHYVFHMLRFIEVLYNINIVNTKFQPIFILFLRLGMGNFFAQCFSSNTHMLK